MTHSGAMRQADIFYAFTAEQLERVVSASEERQFGAGQIIFKENSSSDELYIITRGEVEILVDPALVSDQPDTPSRPTTIATLRRGQSFGEVALVDQGLRSATARTAAADTRLVVIPRAKLMALCDEDPLLGYRLMQNLAADLALKIRNTDLRVREQLLYGERRRT